MEAIHIKKKQALENLTPTDKGYLIHPYASGYKATRL
jgi:hypothetical protein